MRAALRLLHVLIAGLYLWRVDGRSLRDGRGFDASRKLGQIAARGFGLRHWDSKGLDFVPVDFGSLEFGGLEFKGLGVTDRSGCFAEALCWGQSSSRQDGLQCCRHQRPCEGGILCSAALYISVAVYPYCIHFIIVGTASFMVSTSDTAR